MNKANNVIDLKSRLRSNGSVESSGEEGRAPILDMTERRNEIISLERRKVRRTILTEFVGAHVIVPERGLQRISLFDISEDGIAFDLELGNGHFTVGEEVGIRLYLNHETYFPFVVKVTNFRNVSEEGVVRHGASLVKGSLNDVALHHFVKFIETVSASLRTDNGDIIVSGLAR